MTIPKSKQDWLDLVEYSIETFSYVPPSPEHETTQMIAKSMGFATWKFRKYWGEFTNELLKEMNKLANQIKNIFK